MLQPGRPPRPAPGPGTPSPCLSNIYRPPAALCRFRPGRSMYPPGYPLPPVSAGGFPDSPYPWSLCSKAPGPRGTGFHVEKGVFAVRHTLDVQVRQCVHQMAGIYPGPYIANALLPFKNRVVHGENHTARAGGFHDAQVGQLLLGQNGVLELVQRVPAPGGHAHSPLGGVGEHIGLRGGNV